MEARNPLHIRVYWVYGICLLLSLAIIGKILYIQTIQGEMWKQKAQKLSMKYFNIDPNRGSIFDVNGKILATSIPLFEIRMDADAHSLTDSVFDNKVDTLSLCLSTLFKDRSKAEYKKMLIEAHNDGNRYFLIKKNVDYDQLKSLKKFPIFNIAQNECLIAEVQNKRLYPFDNLCCRTIGWYKEESPNNVGIESAFNLEMGGSPGKRLFQRLPDGNWRPLSRTNEIDPVNGSDIFTTIDINIQDVAEEALRKQLIINQADHGCAILMEVKTGEIRAIANLGRKVDGTYQELYNYAIAESTEPGSTFKLYSLLAAFEDNKTTLSDLVDVTGGTTTYANRTMTDSHLGGGVMTVQEAFEKSSNVGISKIITKAYGNSPQEFIDRIHGFGVNNLLGLEIQGEGKPKIYGTKEAGWSNVSLPWKSIGYEVALTPLQILTFYNAVANDGVMVKPHFIREIRRGGAVLKKWDNQAINKKIASDRAIKMAKTMLEAVVERGTGSVLKNPIYKVAGKTGTAQVFQKVGGYNKSNYKGSFVGYFPADKPKYSCIVVINNPTQGAYYGGVISAPVVREIADRIYATDPEVGINWVDSTKTSIRNPFQIGNLNDANNINRWFGNNCMSNSPDKPTSQVLDSIGFSSINASDGIPTIPNLVGLSAKEAVFMLEKLGINVMLKGMGIVKQQSLAVGSRIMPGAQVRLDLSSK